MTGQNDAALLTPAERLEELAELFARGLQRHFAAERKALLAQSSANNCSNRLDVLPTAEAPCCSRVQSPQSRTPA